jgi:hypothetical protein
MTKPVRGSYPTATDLNALLPEQGGFEGPAPVAVFREVNDLALAERPEGGEGVSIAAMVIAEIAVAKPGRPG